MCTLAPRCDFTKPFHVLSSACSLNIIGEICLSAEGVQERHDSGSNAASKSSHVHSVSPVNGRVCLTIPKVGCVINNEAKGVWNTSLRF